MEGRVILGDMGAVVKARAESERTDTIAAAKPVAIEKRLMTPTRVTQT